MNAVRLPGFGAELSLPRRHDVYLARRLREFNDGQPGLVHPARYACYGGGCACQGDVDCNAMFSNACGSGYARCWERGSGSTYNVFCLCAR